VLRVDKERGAVQVRPWPWHSPEAVNPPVAVLV
jgi:hypothetical protein